MKVDGEPRKLRVLGVLFEGTPDAVLQTEHGELGPLEELADVAELNVLHSPLLEELAAAAQEWRPSLVYVYGGAPGSKEEIQAQTVGPLACLLDQQSGALSEPAVQRFLAGFQGLHLEALVLDFAGSAAVADALARSSSNGSSGDSGAEAVQHVVAWPAGAASAPPPALAAWDWAHCFLGLLRSPDVTVPEAFALASHMAKAHGTVAAPPTTANGVDAAAPAAAAVEPATPQLLSAVAGDGGEDGSESGGRASPAAAAAAPAASLLPGMPSVPAPQITGADLSRGVATAFPGYADLRLLAPNAELRLLQAGVSAMVNPHNLRYLGEALRALLTLETRALQVLSLASCDRAPAHLPVGAGATRAEVLTPAGARCTVTLGGPAELLKNKDLVQHALRQAMTADAQTLQLKLPPPGVPPPPTHTSAGVASGAPVVEGLAVTSVWAVQLLKLLAQEASYRGLVLLGVAAISTSPVAAFGPADATRYLAVTAQNAPAQVQRGATPAGSLPEPAHAAAAAAATSPQPPPAGVPGEAPLAPAAGLSPAASDAAAAAAAGGLAGGSAARAATPPDQAAAASAQAAAAAAAEPPKPDISLLLQQQQLMQQQAAAGGPMAWKSSRPPLIQCSEEAFLGDLIAFLTDRQGRQIDPKTFPEAILNGSKLDLYHLYREVVSRGGYKVGNGINWKGQVFPRMRNFTTNHKMTGVGNALKRHYQVFLLEYEQAHPEDVTGDRCGICGRGDEYLSDWVCCDMCECWVHFSCDTRQSRGSFKDYSRGQGRLYHCPRCSEVRRHQTLQLQAQAMVATQVAAAMQQHLQRQADGAAPEAAAQDVAAAGEQQQAQQQQEQQQQQPTAQEQQAQQQQVQPAEAAAAAADGPVPMQE